MGGWVNKDLLVTLYEKSGPMLNMFIPEPLIGIEFMHLGPMSRCLEDAVLLSHIWNLSDA